MKHTKNCVQFTLLPLLVLLAFSACSKDNGLDNQSASVPAPREKVTNVVLATVTRQNLQETFTLPGILEAWEDLTLAAEMAGPVRSIALKEGDPVKKGEAILRIDPEQREAELARDQVEYELQQKRMERRRALVERNLVSQQEFEDSRQAFEQAQAQLRLSKVALEKSTLRSPITGVLDLLLVDRGEYVSEGTAVALVMQVNRLRALVDIPEKDILAIAVGGTAQVSVSPVRGQSGPSIPGDIVHLSYQADPATRSYRAKIAVDNNAQKLRPGMIIQVSFTRSELAQVIAVPLYALVDHDGGKVVFVVQDGKAMLRQVQVGPIVGNLAVIEKGLNADERLIIKGQQLVTNGVSVIVEEF